MIRLAATIVRKMPDPAATCRVGLPRRILAHGAGKARGFTIVELLVAVAIIITLLSILIVAVNAAARASQKARTIALMGSIKQGLIRFKEDVGYYPPVLGVNYTTAGPVGGGPPNGNDLRKLYRNSVPSPNPAVYTGGNYIAHMQEYYSTCTLADYLIGYGSHREDGYGRVPGLSGPAAWEPEDPPLGIRPPGDDGVWGATLAPTANYGELGWRMRYGNANWGGYSNATPAPPPPNGPYPWDVGKVLPPYLELKDERLLAGVYYGPNGLQTYFQGDVLPGGFTWDNIPKAIVDYWGQPIRYYRRPYPPGALGQSYRSTFDPTLPGNQQLQAVPSLSDIYVLRPRAIKPGSESPNPYPDQSTPQNNLSSRELDAAEFALLSAGPDKRLNTNALFHNDNADNIVEVGP